jgi:endonuclease/exonuclease/phosphatase family metal-dependent hydrolase
MRLATWNVLADAYVRPDWYRAVPPELLNPALRLAQVCARASAIEADLLCLQEVDARTAGALEVTLGAQGYRGRWLPKANGRPDGCAIFWRSLDVRDEAALVYPDGSGHVAQSAGFDHVRVITTHLKWDAPDSPLETRWGMRQVDALLTSLLGETRPVIVCGDFNVRADDPVMARLAQAGLRDVFEGADRPHTCVANGRSAKIDHVVTSVQNARPSAAQVDVCGLTALPVADEPSDHVPLVIEF